MEEQMGFRERSKGRGSCRAFLKEGGNDFTWWCRGRMKRSGGEQRAGLVGGSVKGMSGRGPAKTQVPGIAFGDWGLIYSLCWGQWWDTEHPAAILPSFGHSTLIPFGKLSVPHSMCFQVLCIKGHMPQTVSTGFSLQDLNTVSPGHEKCLVFIHSRAEPQSDWERRIWLRGWLLPPYNPAVPQFLLFRSLVF